MTHLFPISLLTIFCCVLLGCSDSTSTLPDTNQAVSPSVPAAEDSRSSIAAPEANTNLQADPSPTLLNALEQISKSSPLPSLADENPENPLNTILADSSLGEIEDSTVDPSQRMALSFAALRGLDKAIGSYRKALSSEQPVGMELASLLRQRCLLAAAAWRMAKADGQLPTGFVTNEDTDEREIETERLAWLLTLSWNEIARTLQAPNWSKLSAAEQSHVLQTLQNATIDLSPVTYEAYRSSIKTSLPKSADSGDLNEQLSKAEIALSTADFAPHLLGACRSLFDLTSVPVPEFPELGEYDYSVEDETVLVWEFALTNDASKQTPGCKMEFRLLLPAGDHQPKSLPCILMAPAGTGLESGLDLDLDSDEVYLAAVIPFVKAGYAVLQYSLDGEEAESKGFDLAASRRAYLQFRSAFGGVVNGRNAAEFARTQVPAINPDALYAAGHSSAGTVALLVAAHDIPIKGVMSFAVVSDVAKENYSLTGNDASFKPGIHSFRVKSSPITHADQVNIPVFLYHGRQDDTVNYAQSQTFEGELKGAGKQVTLVSVDSADHYDAMIEDGIPQAIEWLNSL